MDATKKCPKTIKEVLGSLKSSRYCQVSSRYCPVLSFSFRVSRKQGTFDFFLSILFILLLQYTYSLKSINSFPYTPCKIWITRATVKFVALLPSMLPLDNSARKQLQYYEENDSSAMKLITSSGNLTEARRNWTVARWNWTVARGNWTVAQVNYTVSKGTRR